MTTPNTPAARMGEDRDWLVDFLYVTRGGKSWGYDREDAGRDADAILAAGFTRSAPGWIACSERMPEPREDVMVYVQYPEGGSIPGIGACINGAWFGTFGRLISGVVTHWMPLPTPPARSEGEGA